MKIWLINPYGPIPGEEWREYRFAMIGRALAARGHDVVWWTGGFDHFTKSQRSGTWKTVEASERFKVILVPTPSYRRNVGPGRLLFELVFAWRLLRRAKTQPKPDLVIAADPPQIAGGLVATRLNAPFVLDCLDLWPEVFEGVLPRMARPLLGPLRALRRHTYSRASGAVAATETYRQVLAREVPKLDAIVVYLGIAPLSVNREDHDRFTAIYAGTLGNNYDIETVLDAAQIATDVRFVIAGDGPLKERVVNRARSLPNVEFIGRVAASALPELYAKCDVGLVPYASWSTVAMPVKVFDYLAAGLPLISSIGGELRELMTTCDIGLSYQSGDAQSLAGALRLLASDATRRRNMADNARACALRFDGDDQYSRFADFVERIAAADVSRRSSASR